METKISSQEVRRIGACGQSLSWGMQKFPAGETTWGDLIQLLIDGHTDWLLWLISYHPQTPTAVLETLAKDDYSDVRQGVAENLANKDEVYA